MAVTVAEIESKEWAEGYKAGLREATVHAHWIKTFYAENGYFMGICSHCSMPNIVSLYCGECGAKMDEEDS